MPPAELGPPTRLTPADGHLTWIEVEPGGAHATLDSRVDATWDELLSLGFSPLDPNQSLEGAPAADFARYLTFQEAMPGREVHHVVFVTVGAWTDDREDRFIQTFVPMPYATPTQLGTPVFHFVGEPAPFGVTYVFGNQWWGMLESAALVALEDPSLDVDEQVARAVSRLAEFGVTAEGQTDIDHLDTLLEALPRPEEGVETSYVPAGTLEAIGLAFGAALQRRIGGLEWTDDDATLSVSYALDVTDFEDTFLRPVDYVYQAYEANVTDALANYLELASLRITELRDPE